MTQLQLYWFRRDLRWHDHRGLEHALARARSMGAKVQPLFIFDPDILEHLRDPADARVGFIHSRLTELKEEANAQGSDLWVFYGRPLDIFRDLLKKHSVAGLSFVHDHEPASLQRDRRVVEFFREQGKPAESVKDQTIFERDEILTAAGSPYTVYTPYKNNWLKTLRDQDLRPSPKPSWGDFHSAAKKTSQLPTLQDIGFKENPRIEIPPAKLAAKTLADYATTRDLPGRDTTSRLGIHLRFGTMSPRELVKRAREVSPVWLSELIWREFFMQVLYHFPHVETRAFRPDYDRIEWRTSKSDFERWCEGRTGYPLVDAGLRQLNATGFMHNRVRMVTASFLCKHLLLPWQWGERYFAEKLLDFELASNVGNWQWASGSGCDAAPYFRVFNPEIQLKKFDPEHAYVRRWISEWGTSKYPTPMIDHAEGRDRALRAYHAVLKGKKGKVT